MDEVGISRAQLLEEREQLHTRVQKWQQTTDFWWKQTMNFREQLDQAMFEVERWKSMYELKSSEQDLLSHIITKLEVLNPQEANESMTDTPMTRHLQTPPSPVAAQICDYCGDDHSASHCPQEAEDA